MIVIVIVRIRFCLIVEDYYHRISNNSAFPLLRLLDRCYVHPFHANDSDVVWFVESGLKFIRLTNYLILNRGNGLVDEVLRKIDGEFLRIRAVENYLKYLSLAGDYQTDFEHLPVTEPETISQLNSIEPNGATS